MSSADEEPISYPIRLTGSARKDIDDAHIRFVTFGGERLADEWKESLFAELQRLGGMAKGYPVTVLESRLLKIEVRAFTFERRRSAVSYRVLYAVVSDEQHELAGAGDPPFVLLLHVHHAARRPMTRKEADALRRSLDTE